MESVHAAVSYENPDVAAREPDGTYVSDDELSLLRVLRNVTSMFGENI